MSTQIIPIFTGVLNQEQIQLVNARELHQFLEVTSRFNNWINNRISEYQFVEHIDFILVTKNLVIKSRGADRRSKDYNLTMDTAKELSMVERTEKGRQARNNKKEALDAIIHAVPILAQNYKDGYSKGFYDQIARWALTGMLEHKGDLSLPFKTLDMGIEPKEGFNHYLNQI